jgi:hypothetical protein
LDLTAAIPEGMASRVCDKFGNDHFAILIADARSFQPPIDVAPLNGLPIALAPRSEADRDR